MNRITFDVNNQKLVGNLFYPQDLKEKNPTILFLHGWTSRQDRVFQYAESLAKRGFICMTFDMRGHGSSEGDLSQLSRDDFLEDVLTAYDLFLTVKGVDPENISVVGSSFGSYLGAILASKRQVKSLVLRVPANYPNDGFNEPHINLAKKPQTYVWRMEKRSPTETFSLDAVHNFSGDILIVESEHDELVPHQTIQNYKDAVRDQGRLAHVVMKGATHGISGDEKTQKEFEQILLDWFAKPH